MPIPSPFKPDALDLQYLGLTVAFRMCCNDDNGNFAGSAGAVEVGAHPNLRLSTGWDYPRALFDGTHLTVGAVRMECRSTWEYCGSICWTEFGVRWGDCLRWLNHPYTRKVYGIDEGESRIYRTWELGQCYVPGDLRILLKD